MELRVSTASSFRNTTQQPYFVEYYLGVFCFLREKNENLAVALRPNLQCVCVCACARVCVCVCILYACVYTYVCIFCVYGSFSILFLKTQYRDDIECKAISIMEDERLYGKESRRRDSEKGKRLRFSL